MRGLIRLLVGFLRELLFFQWMAHLANGHLRPRGLHIHFVFHGAGDAVALFAACVGEWEIIWLSFKKRKRGDYDARGATGEDGMEVGWKVILAPRE